MADSKIEWTEKVWNCVRGCAFVSEGCRNCYASRFAHRFSGPGKRYEGLTKLTKDGPKWNGKVREVPEALELPLHWKKPRRVFINSMSDLFMEGVSWDFIDKVMAVIALSPQHTFQLLTKRVPNMCRYFLDVATPQRILTAIDVVSVDYEMSGQREQWQTLDYCPAYEVSSYGRVRRGGKFLKQSHHRGGYLQVALCMDGKPRTRLVHQLVLEAFDRTSKKGEEAAHCNGKKHDNRLANLRWTTKNGNIQDAVRHGTAGAWMKGKAKLSAEDVSAIRCRRNQGEKLASIADAFGIDKRLVSAIARFKKFKPPQIEWPISNLWLGVSVENQETADKRIPLLLQIPAAVRWVSMEPLIGPVDLDFSLGGTKWIGGQRGCCGTHHGIGMPECPKELHHHHDDRCKKGLDWVVCGGESGYGARPMELSWVRSIRNQCQESETPFFFKQRMEDGKKIHMPELDGRVWDEYPLVK